jgi:prevent-host-death family protein
MTSVGTYEAKTSFSALIARVEQGEQITITRRGIAVAVLVPPPEIRRRSPETLVAEFETFGRGRRLEGMSIRDLVEEGRR